MDEKLRRSLTVQRENVFHHFERKINLKLVSRNRRKIGFENLTESIDLEKLKSNQKICQNLNQSQKIDEKLTKKLT